MSRGSIGVVICPLVCSDEVRFGWWIDGIFNNWDLPANWVRVKVEPEGTVDILSAAIWSCEDGFPKAKNVGENLAVGEERE
jgi:hypothetical protein